MIKKFSFSISLVVVISLLFPFFVNAQEDSTSVESPPTVNGQETTQESRIERYKEQIDQRAEERIAERRIVAGCKKSQQKLDAMQSRVDGLIKKRQETITQRIEKLTTLADKIELSGVDTSELDQAIIAIQEQNTTMSTSSVAYQEALLDSSSMDCVSDPEGFQAALIASRQQRSTAVDASDEIKAIMNQTIKPYLQEVRTQLETPQEGEEE